MDTADAARSRAASLACWSDPVEPTPITGGMTNSNFAVEHGGERFFVRIGNDIPMHGVIRWNEVAASRAAHAAGISPEVVHDEPGVIVLRFIEGKTLTAEDVRERSQLERIVPLLRRCHDDVPAHFRGPVLAFWVFQVLRSYAQTVTTDGGRLAERIPGLMAIAGMLEEAVGPIRLVFGHNDLLAANLVDDGDRLWLIDWDYAGLNSPLFDLAGLASNSELPPEDEAWLLQTYTGTPVTDELWRRYSAMKCASLLRETMWSMAAELHSSIDFDFVGYTTTNLARFERAWADFQAT